MAVQKQLASLEAKAALPGRITHVSILVLVRTEWRRLKELCEGILGSGRLLGHFAVLALAADVEAGGREIAEAPVDS